MAVTRSEPNWGCEVCSARRVTREGMESHLRHKHPAAYFLAIHTDLVVYHHIP